MAVPRLGGAGIGLSVNNGLVTSTTNPGIQTGLTNTITLSKGEVWNIPPGTWMIYPGPYTFLQWKDPVSGVYRVRPCTLGSNEFIISDGANWRLANTTGCPIGALITTGSSGLTNGIGSTATGLTVTASTGSSVWQPVVGGALSSAATVVTSGSGYLFPPIVVIDAPPQGGTQATAVAALNSGGVSTVTMINQGAGYTTAPTITLLNDPRDTAGTGAAFTAVTTGSGVLTALYPTDHGNAITTVPTLTFAPTGPTATVIMNFSVTGFSVTSGGDSYVGAFGEVISSNHITSGSPAFTDPLWDTQLTWPRPCRITAPISSNAPTSGSLVLEDQGLGIQKVPDLIFLARLSGGSTFATLAATVGGVTDTSFIQPI